MAVTTLKETLFTIYKTTNLINGRFYVGMHKTHKIDDFYLGSGKALKHAIKNYGRGNFKKEILHVFKTFEEACEMEKQIVNKGFIENPMTYNMQTGGEAPYASPSEETKEKIRQSNLGKKRSDETRQRNREANLGKKLSEETKEKMRNRIPWIKGKKHSEESKKKMSESLKGRPAWNKGKKASEESKRKMSEATKGQYVSPETKGKLRLKAKIQWAKKRIKDGNPKEGDLELIGGK
jgi:hypothetical protein